MSRKIKERTKQLAAREKEIKKQLLGSSGSKSKANKIGKTALAGGIAAFILYASYKAFFQTDKKPKKNKAARRSSSGIVAEKVIMLLLPYLAEILENFIRSRSLEKKKEELSNKEESSEKED
ncbi:MAG: hypothetical protein RIM99_17265 [Cyclobacteriaceae bacterium]